MVSDKGKMSEVRPEPDTSGVDCDRLRRHVAVLAGEVGERNVFRPGALRAAADYISGQWHGQGYRVAAQTYLARGVSCANLEVTRVGADRPRELILVGAHYDSVAGSPGANDNGSGVAVMLEISRLFAAARPGCGVRFVAFVNEEPPFFFWGRMGSKVYARAARLRGDDIRLMASLETLGYYRDEPGSQRYPPLFRWFYPKQGNFLAFVSNFRSRRAMLGTVAAFRAHCRLPAEHLATFAWVPGVAWSDHYPFWRQGYRALMVTDTAFYRYPYYHSAQDTPDKLDYTRLALATQGLYHAFLELAGGR